VYNIEVDGFHTYYVGNMGVWVHNASCFAEEFDSPEAAIGEAAINGIDWVGSGTTNDVNIYNSGYTEVHYYEDSDGTQWTVFHNPTTGRWGGAHESSSNW
jgi:hypothetical protein